MKVTRQVYKEIKARLQEAPGYTQKEVAQILGVAQSTVDRVVKSRNYKNYHELIKEHNLQQAKRKEYQALKQLIQEEELKGRILQGVWDPENYDRKSTKTVNKAELLRLVKEISTHLDNVYTLLKQLKGGLK